MAVGQADAADPVDAPGSDGSGTGVPENSTISNVSQIFASIAQSVGQTFRAVNQPQLSAQQQVQVQQSTQMGKWIPVVLIGVIVFAIFKG